MGQDYSNLYGAPQTAAPPQPAEPPKPFVMNSSEAELPLPKPFTMNSADVQPEAPPTPFSMNSADVQTPPPQPYMRPVQQPAAAAPPKPKQPFSPIPLLLFAGVAFLFLGGALVLAQTWETLADSARAVILLLFSMMFFGANLIAEKVFRLPRTGLAFYILGTIFLPLAVAAIGVFKLFGEWFSFAGDGRFIVGAVICACFGVSTLVGTHSYKSPLLAWLSLAAAAAGVLSLDCFLIDNDEMSSTMKLALFFGVYTAFNVLCLLWTEWILRSKPDTPYGKAALLYQYPLMVVTSILFGAMGLLVKDSSPIPAVLALLALFAGFFYPRYDRKSVHIGTFGMPICLVAAFGVLCREPVFSEVKDYAKLFFALSAAAFVLMSLRYIPKLPDSLRKTAPVLGYALNIPLLFSSSTICFVASQNMSLFVMHCIMIAAALFFLLAPRNKFPEDAAPCALSSAVVFLCAQLGTADGNTPIMLLLLVIAAVTLTIQALLGKRLWCFVLAASAAAGMLVLNLTNASLWLLWECAAITLAGVIYAHVSHRPLLERSFAWCFIACCLPALMNTLTELAELDYPATLVLVFAVLTLLYLLETAAFPSHERVQGTRPFLELLSFVGAFAALVACLAEKETGNGWYFLLSILIGVFAVCLVTKRINYVAIPHLIMFYAAVQHLIAQITAMQLTAWGLNAPGSMSQETLADLIQVGCNMVVLIILALTGRFLLPKFIESGDGIHRADLPLLTGILVIISTVATLKWYPQILFWLFMCAYSLLFIGRLQNRRIPALLASLSGCMALLFHNIHDPFGLLDKLSVLDIKSLPLMMYLLPAHLFILTLLVILPERCKNGVHIARFVMYCITMLALLIASMYFKNVTDALVLVIFSFLILVGSFFPKRLRWFALGFTVLVFMTVRLTWSFWKSLHWGIYLFLAGILLIAIASIYEYSARYAREHPDEPKKKFTLFAAWKW
ncbi:MAG: hypothetical protein IJ906_16770 [Oscillospiraceae bacterium]|nr:hypothetical protein [Oscillospiraceae bacterium]